MAARKKSNSKPSGRSGVASLVAGVGRGVTALWPSWPALRTGAVVAAWLAAGGGLVGAAWWGVPKLKAYAESRSAIDPAQVRIVFERAPSWLPQQTIDELGQRARAALEGAQTFESDALQRVHVALSDSGWLERLEQVRRNGADEIVVTADFRAPYAMVRSAEADHLVDETGRRLPLAYEGAVKRPQLPLILNVSMPKPAEAGGLWIGQDVRAALNVARLVRGKQWFNAGQVAAIDAHRYAGEQIIEIETKDGNRIIWGSDPEARSLGEMPPDRKIACLDALWREKRRIDDGSGRTLDLRFDVVTLSSAAIVPTDDDRAPAQTTH